MGLSGQMSPCLGVSRSPPVLGVLSAAPSCGCNKGMAGAVHFIQRTALGGWQFKAVLPHPGPPGQSIRGRAYPGAVR